MRFLKWFGDAGWRARRRRDALALVLATVLIFGGTVAVVLWADGERIGQYWTMAVVEETGTTQVIEVIDYDFGSWPREKHGILREIPDVARGTEFAVSSPTAPDDLRVTTRPIGFGVELRIGDPDVVIRNRHRYRIDYPIDTLVADDVFAWNAVGLAWRVPMDDVEVHVVASREFEDPVCDRGARSAIGGCDVVQVEPGHLVVQTSGVSSGEAVTVSGVLGRSLAEQPALPQVPVGPADDPGSGAAVPGIIAGLATMVGIAVTWWVVRRLGRERVWQGGPVGAAFGPDEDSVVGVRLMDHSQLSELATIEFAPPEGLSATAGGVIYDEHVRPQHKVAWLIERAIDDEIVIDAGGPATTLQRGTAEPSPGVASTLHSMFGRRDQVTLGRYDSRFAAGWNALGTKLESWREHSGLWDPRGRVRRRRAQLAGLALALVGLAAVGGGAAIASRSGGGVLMLVAAGGALAGAGLTAALRAWELPIRTPEGSAQWLLIESFRRFIANSEARHAEAAARLGLLRHYTAWAVALGELDHWEHAVAEAATMPASAVASQGSALHLVNSAPGLTPATQKASIAPSSSGGGGGGGGGGGAGGGGGGGGGGSW